MTRLHRAVVPFAALLLVAACGGSASPSPSSAPSEASSPSIAASPTVAPSPSEAASPSVAESPGQSPLPSGALPSGLNQVPDLEAQLPNEVGGETLTKLSLKGSSVLQGGGQVAPEITAALGAVGKTIDDVAFAVAGAEDIQMGAYRVAGLDANRLLSLIQQAMASSGSGGFDITDGNKGGKPVKIGKPKSGSGSTTYFYAHGDVLFFVSGDDDAKVTEALSKLP